MLEYFLNRSALAILSFLSLTCLSSFSSYPDLKNDLPEAPEGYSWICIENLTDEFNSETLNPDKWIPKHPYWSGRNSTFTKANVSVGNGCLNLKSTLQLPGGEAIAKNINSACVSSKDASCGYGYYEARIKCSDISMTSAFWFQGKFSEIDVIENIGNASNPESTWINNTMMTNTHYFQDGWENDIKTPFTWEMPTLSAADYHVYGVWWKDEKTVIFYHNGMKIHEVLLEKPFNEKQYMFFDTEVFTWHGWPTKKSLLNDYKNTMKVDWVRAWELVKDRNLDKKLTLGNAQIKMSNNVITVSTGKIERKWQLTENGLQTISLSDLSHRNNYFSANVSRKCDWDLPGLINETSEAILTGFQITINEDDGFTSKHLQAICSIRYPESGLEIQHEIWVYPDAPGIRTQLRVKRNKSIEVEKLPFEEGERIDCGNRIAVPSARTEFLPLDFSRENVRRYWGYYNNPGGRHDPSRDMLEEKIVTGYPLFLPEDINWASGISVEYNEGANGVCVVKESPKCVNEQSHYTGSFYSGQDGLSVTGWGLTPDEIVTDRYRECWASWTILWSGGNDGLQLALKQFDRARYPVYEERDMFIQSNTWGPADPGGSQFTEEEYLLKEIPALANLGIDVMQIDDSWQRGGLSTGARDFSPRYPDGWKNIKAEMDKYGMRFGTTFRTLLLPIRAVSGC